MTRIEVTYTQASTPTKAADPVFDVAEGTVDAGTSVTVSYSEGEKLWVWTDGTKIEGITENPYTYTVNKTVTLSAQAYVDESDESTYSNKLDRTYTVSTTPTPPVGGTVKWVETDITQLASGDVVIIVDKSSGKALDPKGSISSPAATSVTFNSDKTEITDGTTDNMWFQIEKSGSNYSFTHVNSSPDRLYTIDDSKGVRVGSNSNDVFTWESGYLKNTGMSRYIGVYSNDWRCYTNSNLNNIKSTTTAFYKKVVEQPTCELPVFTVNGVALANGDIMEVEPGTEVTVSCPTAGATIASLTINKLDETAAEGKNSYTFRIYGTTEVEVMYVNGDVMSDVATAAFTLTNVKGGGEFELTSLSEFKTGDQMVLVNQANLYSMSSLPTTGSAKANTVTLSEDKTNIASSLTNAEVFTVEKNADNTISLRSNVLNGDSPLYLQYVGSGAEISIAPLANAEGDLHKFDVKTEQLAGGDYVEQLCVHSNNGRFIRYNGSEAWDAHTGVATDTYTSFYRKPAPVEAPAAAVFTPAPGAVLPGTEVSVTCPTPGAKLDIMVSGTKTEIMDTDVDLSTLPNSAYTFTVTENVDVLATTWVYDNNGTTKLSTSAEASYSIKLPDAPVADSKGGVITEATTVTLTTDQEGATINWKLDNGTGVTTGNGPSPVQVLVDGTATLTYWTSIKVGEQEYKSEEITLSFTLKEATKWSLANQLIPGKRYMLVGINSKENPRVYFAANGHDNDHTHNIVIKAEKDEKNNIYFAPDDNGGFVNNIHKHITVYDATLPCLIFEETQTSGQYKLRYLDPANPAKVQYLTNASSGNNNYLYVSDGATRPIYPAKVEFVENYGSVKLQFVGSSSHNSIAFNLSTNPVIFSSYGSTSIKDFDNTKTSGQFWPFLYACETPVPMAKENIKFSDDAENMNSTTETIVTGYDWTTGDPKTITGTTSQVDNGYIYVYYDLAATAEQAAAAEVNPGVLKYGKDTYGAPEAANYANNAQTAPVKLRVEVELLGNKDGDFSTYKMPNPDVPGGWDDQTYLKYYGVNQTRIHDVDAPYVKVPITSQYSVVRATAVGDGVTHTGTVDADVHAYYSPNGSTTGVEGVEAGSDSDAEVKYYNLQGVRVSRPSNGVYIRVEGNRVSKVRVF